MSDQNQREPKLNRLFNRERKVQEIFQEKPEGNKGYRYYLMELKYEDEEKFQELLTEKRKQNNPLVKIRMYNSKTEGDPELLVELFNTILMTSPDPYRPLTLEEVKKYFNYGTFIAFIEKILL